MSQLSQVITEVIEDSPAIKNVELIVRVRTRYGEDFAHFEYFNTLERLLNEGKIIEIEFVTPQQGDRIKSLYFPSNTKFNIKKGN